MVPSTSQSALTGDRRDRQSRWLEASVAPKLEVRLEATYNAGLARSSVTQLPDTMQCPEEYYRAAPVDQTRRNSLTSLTRSLCLLVADQEDRRAGYQIQRAIWQAMKLDRIEQYLPFISPFVTLCAVTTVGFASMHREVTVTPHTYLVAQERWHGWSIQATAFSCSVSAVAGRISQVAELSSSPPCSTCLVLTGQARQRYQPT